MQDKHPKNKLQDTLTNLTRQLVDAEMKLKKEPWENKNIRGSLLSEDPEKIKSLFDQTI